MRIQSHRHFVLLVVVAIVALSSRLIYAVRATRAGTAVSLTSTDDKISTFHPKRNDAEKEERTPFTGAVSAAAVDSKITGSLTNKKPELSPLVVEAASDSIPMASLGKTISISKSQLTADATQLSRSLSKSKEVRDEIPAAASYVEKHPQLVEDVVSSPSVREATATLSTTPSIKAKRNLFARVAKAVKPNLGKALSISALIAVIVFLCVVAFLVFSPKV